MSFVQSYFADIEKTLLALSGVAGNAGHSVIKGSAREYFVKEFLSKNISPLRSVGSGEIIHRETQAPDKRNQIDAVVYSGQVPRFEYEPGCSAFLIKGVAAFIEVKTKLTKAHLKAAIEKTRCIKGYLPDGRLHKLHIALEIGKLDVEDITPRIKEVKAQLDDLKARRSDLEERILTDPGGHTGGLGCS